MKRGDRLEININERKVIEEISGIKEGGFLMMFIE
jgi:hypothetical protein